METDFGERFFPVFIKCLPVFQFCIYTIIHSTRDVKTLVTQLVSGRRFGTIRERCDNASTMPDDERPAEIFPIAYSTAYLCLAALITIRTNEDGDHDQHSVEYATRVLELVKAQPETVLNLPPDQLEETGPSILTNSRAWLN